jgi:3-hydroxy-3-methylglutaryl CoA synthase
VGSAAVAVLIGQGAALATVDATTTVSSDVTDFWRRDRQRFPAVVGKFTVEIGSRSHHRVVYRLLRRPATLSR